MKSSSRRQEDRIAASFVGKRNAMSGAGWVRKNDVRSDRFLLEAKTTGNTSSITLKSKDLEGLRVNALKDGRIPVLCFDLNGRHYVVLREDDFVELSE